MYCRTLARPNLTPVVASGGSRVERQVDGTNGEAPDFGRGLLLFWGLRWRLQPIPNPPLNQAPRRGFKPSKIRDAAIVLIAH
jgi:hypothetical protein